MRQLWPDVSEHRLLFMNLTLQIFLLSIFLLAVSASPAEAIHHGLASGARGEMVHQEQLNFVEHDEFDPGSATNAKALATVTPQDSDVILRAERLRTPGAAGLGAVDVVRTRGGQRSLKDFEVEDFVLLGTINGALSARDRKTGAELWEIHADEPVVRTIYHRANATTPDARDYSTWIVGPTEDGELFQFSQDRGLEKLGYTVKDIVGLSPFSPDLVDEVYNGEKKTTSYIIDARTGDIQNVFSTSGMAGMVNKKQCIPTTGLQQLECETPKAPESVIMIARTEYTISIQDRLTGELLWTIKFNQWGPNNSDRDLLAQYERSIDDRYILSGHDGMVYSFESFEDSPEKKPSWKREMSSPVIAAFDVVKPLADPDSTKLMILNQPLIQSRDNKIDARDTWVGLTHEGGVFAMSELKFPYVTQRSQAAGCYDKLDNWEMLDIPERQKFLVGNHRARVPSVAPQPLGINGYDDSERETEVGNASPPATPQSTSDNSPSTLGTLIKAVTEHGKAVVSLCFVMGLLAFLLGNPLGTHKHFLYGEEKRLPSVVQLEATPSEPTTSPVADHIPDEIVEDVGTQVEKPRKPTVKFAEEPAEVEHKAEGGDEPNGAVTPKRRKPHRGKRGGAGRKKNGSAGNSEKSSDEKEPPQVAQPDTNLTMVADGHVQEVVPSQHETLNNLTIYMDVVLGTGSQGTIVYDGLWEKKPVAVKKIPTVFMEIAEHEVQLLQQTDYHENVVRYYCRQQKFDSIYIALEKCPGSLYDLFVKAEQPLFRELRTEMDKDVRNALYQITRGLDHLHSLKVVHRDIKPQNILVGAPNFPNPKDPKSRRPRMLISDFGLCKKLQTDEYSFGVTTAHNAGTVGWRAPELLREWDPKAQQPNLKPQDKESSGGTASGTEVIVDSHTKRRATKAIDIFALGCVFYFVLSNGLHPFGERIEREYNIIQGKYDLDALDRFDDDGTFEARDLVSSMIQRDPKRRPDTKSVATHPFFWPEGKSLDFLVDVSDRFEVEKDMEKNDATYSSPYIPLLEQDADRIVKGDWIKQVETNFYNELFATKRRGYEGTRLLDLLRAIRNKKHHYQDMKPEAQAAVGPLPNGYLKYFSRRFPELVMHAWHVVREAGFQEEPRFERYFTLANW